MFKISKKRVYHIRFLTFTTYKFVLSKEAKVKISVPVVVVGTYEDPLGCLTVEGNDTVADPVVEINNILDCPNLILLGLIYVSVPWTNCKVKKLPKLKFNEAVLDATDKDVTFPCVDPVITKF